MNTAPGHSPESAERPLPDAHVTPPCGAGGGTYSGRMGIEEQSRKLRQIANISTVAELDGWEVGMKTRATFPGEQAALMQRRIELKAPQPKRKAR